MIAYWLWIMGACIVAASCYIAAEYAGKFEQSLPLKGAASALAVLFGFLCFNATRRPDFGAYLFAGLVLAAVGDALLALRHADRIKEKGKKTLLHAGLLLLLAGRATLTAAAVSRRALALALAAAFAALALFLLIKFGKKRLPAQGPVRALGAAYVPASFLSAGAAVSLAAIEGSDFALFAAGAALLCASDVLFVFWEYGKDRPKLLRAVQLAAYYAALLLFALNMLLI